METEKDKKQGDSSERWDKETLQQLWLLLLSIGAHLLSEEDVQIYLTQSTPRFFSTKVSSFPQ